MDGQALALRGAPATATGAPGPTTGQSSARGGGPGGPRRGRPGARPSRRTGSASDGAFGPIAERLGADARPSPAIPTASGPAVGPADQPAERGPDDQVAPRVGRPRPAPGSGWSGRGTGRRRRRPAGCRPRPGGPDWTIRPRSITARWSASARASRASEVRTRVVVSASARTRRISSRNSSRTRASSRPSGSSRISRSGSSDQGPGQGDPLPLEAGELVGPLVGQAVEPGRAQRLGHPRPCGRARPTPRTLSG